MEAIQFIKFIENSTSKSFLAKCSDSRYWVIRSKKKDKNSKRLFSEYIAGTLAENFGINHPKVKLVKIPSKIVSILNGYDNIFDENCSVGVASLYIKNLKKIMAPKVKSFLEPTFPQINIEHLQKELSDVKNFEQIYGLKVFSHWIYLTDYHKYENIQVTADNKIMFLDFDLSFESNENSWGRLPEYSFIKINTNQASFWEGYTDDIKPFQYWLDKLIELSPQEFLNKLEALPICWGVPKNYLENICDYIFKNRGIFIEEFKRGIDFHRELKSLKEN
jgi:hypothetical protein